MSDTKRRSWLKDWIGFLGRWGRLSGKKMESDRYLTRDGCGKPPGFDCSAKREGNRGHCAGHGPAVKRRTHRAERRQARNELHAEMIRTQEELSSHVGEQWAERCIDDIEKDMARYWAEVDRRKYDAELYGRFDGSK